MATYFWTMARHTDSTSVWPTLENADSSNLMHPGMRELLRMMPFLFQARAVSQAL